MCREELGSQVAREGPRTPRAFFCTTLVPSACDLGPSARAIHYNRRVSIRLGIDTGGTFTDFVRLEANDLVVYKLRSTPDDPSRAILAGVTHLTPSGARREVVHG